MQRNAIKKMMTTHRRRPASYMIDRGEMSQLMIVWFGCGKVNQSPNHRNIPTTAYVLFLWANWLCLSWAVTPVSSIRVCSCCMQNFLLGLTHVNFKPIIRTGLGYLYDAFKMTFLRLLILRWMWALHAVPNNFKQNHFSNLLYIPLQQHLFNGSD